MRWVVARATRFCFYFLSLCLSLSLSLCLSLCLSLSLSLSVSLFVSLCLSLSLSVSLSLSLSVSLSLSLSLSLSVSLCLSLCVSLCVSLSLSFCVSLCLSLCLSLSVSLSLSFLPPLPHIHPPTATFVCDLLHVPFAQYSGARGTFAGHTQVQAAWRGVQSRQRIVEEADDLLLHRALLEVSATDIQRHFRVRTSLLTLPLATTTTTQAPASPGRSRLLHLL
eukprot:COSAG05_NODE_292_length_12012_cov_12.968354_3_plen_222_part_00